VYTVREKQAKQKGLNLNKTLHTLFCANDDNILGKIKHTSCQKKGSGRLSFRSKAVSLVGNAN
jgi:hypothetical protein